MENIDGISNPGVIDNPKGASHISDPNLTNPVANAFHRLPVRWIATHLNLPQFETKVPPDAIWKRTQSIQRVPKENNGPCRLHMSLYQFQYKLASTRSFREWRPTTPKPAEGVGEDQVAGRH